MCTCLKINIVLERNLKASDLLLFGNESKDICQYAFSAQFKDLLNQTAFYERD